MEIEIELPRQLSLVQMNLNLLHTIFATIAGLSCWFILFGDTYDKRIQREHVKEIVSTNEISIRSSDFYYAKPFHTYRICNLICDLAQVKESEREAHFNATSLQLIANEYMNKIYNPLHFPLTYRKDVIIKPFTSQDVNYIYIKVCRDCWREQPSEVPGYLLGVFMVIVIIAKTISGINRAICFHTRSY